MSNGQTCINPECNKTTCTFRTDKTRLASKKGIDILLNPCFVLLLVIGDSCYRENCKRKIEMTSDNAQSNTSWYNSLRFSYTLLLVTDPILTGCFLIEILNDLMQELFLNKSD